MKPINHTTMNSFESKFYEKWQRTREKGMWRFLSLQTATAFLFIHFILFVGQFIYKQSFDEALNAFTIENSVTYLVGCFLLSIYLWKNNESRFKKLSEKE